MSGKRAGEKLSEIDTQVTKHYDIVRRLGKGAYGIVWKAVDKRNKEIVAVKKIFDAFRNQTDAQRTFREIVFLLSFANHENIIQLIGLHKADNDRDFYLVFEYMETDLHNLIKRSNILKDIHKVFIMYQLLKAIKYIHSGNVIHRDLKPSNILLNAQCHCKIADFGLARSVSQLGDGDGETGSDPALTDYVATRWYRAPEILIASKRYTKGIDMWSLGCILGEMLLGKPLFPGSSTVNQVERIMATLPAPTEEDLASVSAGYGTNLLEKSPTSPHKSLEELLPEVANDALDLVGNLIVFNPNYRLTAVEALEHPYVARFHVGENEPERGSNVIPFLRDDVQLSIGEYRSKLYSMMDEKNYKQNNIANSKKFSERTKTRIRRISEHLKKEPSSPVQVDNVTRKSFHLSCDDLRKGKSKSDICKAFFLEEEKRQVSKTKKEFSNGKESKGSQIVNSKIGERISWHDAKYPSVSNVKVGKGNVIQYAYNFDNDNFRNPTPSHAKSCLYLSQQQQQQQMSRSQRSIQSDQQHNRASTSYASQQTKMRRSCTTLGRNLAADQQQQYQHHYRSTKSISDQLQGKFEGRPIQDESSVSRAKYLTRVSQDVRRHMMPPEAGDTHQSRVVRDYLNQQHQQHTHIPQIQRHFKSADSSFVKSYQQPINNNNNNNNRLSNGFRNSKNFGCYGVISASTYRDLRNSILNMHH